MSYRYSSSSGGGGDSRRHSSSSRRDSPPRHRSRRSPSPGPSRGRREKEEARDPKTLPESFGRIQESVRPEDDNTNILQRMKTHYQSSPLSDLYECITDEKKVKIWTRNYKEVRGVMTGYIIAFDKHWNVVLKDVDEVFLKPKKSKTPYLKEIGSSDSFVEMPAKVPRQKKEGAAAPPEPPKEPKEGEKKKKRRKKAKSTSAKRQIDKLFVRGDNIVMVCPLDDPPAAEEEEEEEEEEEGETGRSSG